MSVSLHVSRMSVGQAVDKKDMDMLDNTEAFVSFHPTGIVGVLSMYI